MVTNSHQTGMPEVLPQARSIWFGRRAGWLIVGVVVASLLVGSIWNHYAVRYPGADHLSTNQFHMTFQYQTADELPKVLRWYTRHYAMSHEWPQGDNCVLVTGEDNYLFLKGSLAITLCAQRTRTLIIVDRGFAVH